MKRKANNDKDSTITVSKKSEHHTTSTAPTLLEPTTTPQEKQQAFLNTTADIPWADLIDECDDVIDWNAPQNKLPNLICCSEKNQPHLVRFWTRSDAKTYYDEHIYPNQEYDSQNDNNNRRKNVETEDEVYSSLGTLLSKTKTHVENGKDDASGDGDDDDATQIKETIQFPFKDTIREISTSISRGTRIVSKEISAAGKRSYAVAWMPHFVRYLLCETKPHERTFHESMEVNTHCRLHLDIDLKLRAFSELQKATTTTTTTEGRPTSGRPMDQYAHNRIAAKWLAYKATFDKSVIRLLEALVIGLAEHFGLLGTHGDIPISWVVLDASHLDKMSQHIIVTINQDAFLFKNRRSVGNYIRTVIKKETQDLHDQIKTSIVDYTTRFDNRSLPKIEVDEPISANNVSSATSEDDCDYTNSNNIKHSYAAVLSSIDMIVYEGAREFRLLESTKHGEDRPLQLKERRICTLAVEKGATTPRAHLKDSQTTKHLSFHYDSTKKAFYRKRINTLAFPLQTLVIKKSRVHFDDSDCEEMDDICDLDHSSSVTTKVTSTWAPNLANWLVVEDEIKKDMSLEFLLKPPDATDALDTKSVVNLRDIFYQSLVVPFFHKSLPYYRVLDTITLLSYVDPRVELALRMNDLREERKRILANMLSHHKDTQGATPEDPAARKKEHSLIRRMLRQENLLTDGGADHNNDDNDDDYDDDDDDDDDDMLGVSIIEAIAKNIARKMKISRSHRLVHQREYKVGEPGSELHYLMYSTKPGLKACQLKAQRCGSDHGYHGKNNVYFMVRLNDYTFYQKCHNEKCREYYVKNIAKVERRIGEGHNKTTEGDEDYYNRLMSSAHGPHFKLSQDLHARVSEFRYRHEALDKWDQKHVHPKLLPAQ